MKKYFYLLISISVLFTSCQFFKNEVADEMPKEISQEELAVQRYKAKKDLLTKTPKLFQTKTSTVDVSINNVIPYSIIDDPNSNIGDGFIYYILDIAIDNHSNEPFDIRNFIASCHLTNEDPTKAYANVGYVLKMYSLQTDSLENDETYLKRFYKDELAAKDVIKGKVFAYEVSKDDKSELIFHYKINEQNYKHSIREKQFSIEEN